MPGLAVALLTLHWTDRSPISEWSLLIYFAVILAYFEALYRFNRRRYNLAGSRLKTLLTTSLDTRKQKTVAFFGALVLLVIVVLIPQVLAA